MRLTIELYTSDDTFVIIPNPKFRRSNHVAANKFCELRQDVVLSQYLINIMMEFDNMSV